MVQSAQATYALYPIVVRLLETLTVNGVLDKSDVSKLLELAITDLKSEAHMVDRPEAISLIQDQLLPHYRR